MARRLFWILVLLSATMATILASPASPPVVPKEDVSLNSVLPEAEVQSSKYPQTLPDKQLELVPEHTTTNSPDVETVTTQKPSNSTYFSRVITSIFEIPIAVLTAVRNLLHTAASTQPKLS